MTQRPRPFDEADLHAYVDGQMELDRRPGFMEALAGDPEMLAKVESWKRQNQALTATFGPVLAEQIPVRLLPMSLARETQPPLTAGSTLRTGRVQAGPSAPHPRASSNTVVLAAAAVAFLSGIVCTYAAAEFGWGAGSLGGRHRVESVILAEDRSLPLRAYEAHETYATDLNHPVELPASDHTHLLKWIQHRLSMPIRIPDLTPQGWSLLGGRVLPGEVGPAAFLVYGNGIERLGLYIARTNTRQSETYHLYDNGAGLASVAYWIDEPVGYALTTSRDSSWFDKNGAALYRSVRAQARDNASAF